MQRRIGLTDNQIMFKVNIVDLDAESIENAMRALIANGVNLIIGTTWDYMDMCEKMANEFPHIVFAHCSGYKSNKTNFINYFGKMYQARYLSGIIAGRKTQNGKIGFVAAMGKESGEVCSGLNAFALGVERVNPGARIYAVITYNWFDPPGEASAARKLIAAGCDVIAQYCDTPNPQIEAEKAGIIGIGSSSDMYPDAPRAVLTSVIWKWEEYYTTLVRSIIKGEPLPESYLGSLQDGMVDLTALNTGIPWDDRTLRILGEERQRITSGAFDVFEGVLETNDGERVGSPGSRFAPNDIMYDIHWFYRNIIELE
jgi:basic membrane protein A